MTVSQESETNHQSIIKKEEKRNKGETTRKKEHPSISQSILSPLPDRDLFFLEQLLEEERRERSRYKTYNDIDNNDTPATVAFTHFQFTYHSSIHPSIHQSDNPLSIHIHCCSRSITKRKRKKRKDKTSKQTNKQKKRP